MKIQSLILVSFLIILLVIPNILAVTGSFSITSKSVEEADPSYKENLSQPTNQIITGKSTEEQNQDTQQQDEEKEDNFLIKFFKKIFSFFGK